MPYLPSLPSDAPLLDVFRAYPDTSSLLLDYRQALLRGPFPFTEAERELIAAYVSGAERLPLLPRHPHGHPRGLGISEGTLAEPGHAGRRGSGTRRAGMTRPSTTRCRCVLCSI